MTLSTSAFFALTADISMKSACISLAIIRARVVFPVPGGPHKIKLIGSWCSTIFLRIPVGPTNLAWPTTSSNVRGRMRSARGIRLLSSMQPLYNVSVKRGGFMEIVLAVIIILFLYVIAGFKVINQYQRGVVLTLGRYTGIRQPGFRMIWPIFQKVILVDVRSTPIDVPQQEVITRDNVTVNVDAVVYFRVIDSAKAVLETTNYTYATSQFAQAALRDVTGNFELDDLLSKREEISLQIKNIVDSQTDQWGIDVENVKLQNIELPADMKRAMAKQAEAERERRAAVINAEGEKAAASAVAEAAKMLAATSGGINIRTLQTLEKISSEPSQKTIVVLPSDLTGMAASIIKK